MSEPIDLAAARVAKSDNAKDWSPRDALQHALDKIDRGELDPALIYIAMVSNPYQREGQWTASYDHVCAGGNNVEMTGLLAMHMAKCTRGIE